MLQQTFKSKITVIGVIVYTNP